MKIGVRVDGGKKIGMGHIQRCLALAVQLKKERNTVIFLIRKNKETREIIERKKFEVIELKSDINLKEDLKNTIKIIKSLGINILITDSYKFDGNYLGNIRKNVSSLVSIDDLAKIYFFSDIVINQNIHASNLKYRSLEDTEFLLGPKYALLRKEFAGVEKKRINKKVKNILITTGGADLFGLTLKALNALGGIKETFDITVVVGPFFKNADEIKSIIGKMNKKVNLVINPQDMKELMLSSDLAITSGGTTLYELAATGTPAIVFCAADNQKGSIRGMSRIGTIINVGRGDHFSKKNFQKEVKKLIPNFLLRKQMSEKGQKLVDGRGSMRCAKRICN